MTKYVYSDGGATASCNSPFVFALGDGTVVDFAGMLGVDHTAVGFVTIDSVAGEDMVFGDLCFFKSDNKFWKTDADAVATTEGELAIALGSITAEATGEFLKQGYIRDDSWSFTISDINYVGTTLGNITATRPSSIGDCVRRIGYAHATNIIWFAPDLLVLEL